MPWAEFLVKWEALLGHLALARLTMSSAALLARPEMSSEHVNRSIEKAQQQAFPGG